MSFNTKFKHLLPGEKSKPFYFLTLILKFFPEATMGPGSTLNHSPKTRDFNLGLSVELSNL
jgi:hypothetical protein